MFQYASLPQWRMIFTLATLLTTPLLALGQSGSRYNTNSAPTAGKTKTGSPPVGGAASRARELRVGLQGYCPVCLVEMRQWIRGDARFAVEYDGRKYYFPGQEQVEKFRQNPLKYVPILGGDDVVQYAHTGKRTDGRLNHGVFHKGRTYFFASGENKRLFQSNPAKYENGDLAFRGECVVCRVDMNQRVSGKWEFTVLYNGLRYQFPAKEQQAAFMRSPTRYVEALSAPPERTPVGSGTHRTTSPRQPSGGSASK